MMDMWLIILISFFLFFWWGCAQYILYTQSWGEPDTANRVWAMFLSIFCVMAFFGIFLSIRYYVQVFDEYALKQRTNGEERDWFTLIQPLIIRTSLEWEQSYGSYSSRWGLSDGEEFKHLPSGVSLIRQRHIEEDWRGFRKKGDQWKLEVGESAHLFLSLKYNQQITQAFLPKVTEEARKVITQNLMESIES